MIGCLLLFTITIPILALLCIGVGFCTGVQYVTKRELNKNKIDSFLEQGIFKSPKKRSTSSHKKIDKHKHERKYGPSVHNEQQYEEDDDEHTDPFNLEDDFVEPRKKSKKREKSTRNYSRHSSNNGY